MTTTLCEICQQPIDPERLEVLPNTLRCAEHSNVQKFIGYMIPTASKGCASVITLVNPLDTESLRRAHKAHRRHR